MLFRMVANLIAVSPSLTRKLGSVLPSLRSRLIMDGGARILIAYRSGVYSSELISETASGWLRSIWRMRGSSHPVIAEKIPCSILDMRTEFIGVKLTTLCLFYGGIK